MLIPISRGDESPVTCSGIYLFPAIGRASTKSSVFGKKKNRTIHTSLGSRFLARLSIRTLRTTCGSVRLSCSYRRVVGRLGPKTFVMIGRGFLFWRRTPPGEVVLERVRQIGKIRIARRHRYLL